MGHEPAVAAPSGQACSFHHRQFALERLAERKRVLDLTVSVVIPAADEAATVGGVVAALRTAGMEHTALVDELLVIDGASTDGTARAAAEAGAEVLRQAEILPSAGEGAGKGEALWKGLAAARGDLVVFVDADLSGVDGRVLAGLLGPLLVDEGKAFVKAAYERPLTLDGREYPGQGGRVTELMARPLIATFWPQLDWLVQPLVGEFAGRRGALEQLPFVQGYGVELAMLIDLLEALGPDAIAQSDLGRRVHRHQDLAALGRMATEILHVALDRLQAAGRIRLEDPLPDVLRQPVRVEGQWQPEERPVTVRQRPPLAQWGAR